MEYKYIILSDANHNVRVKVNALKGKPPIDTLSQRSSEYSPTTSSDSELFVTCNICYNGQPIGLPASTTFRCFPDSSQIAWNENLSFAVKYRDLPPKSQLVFTVWEVIVTPPDENGSAPPSSVPQGRSGLYPGSRVVPVGGTSMPLFNKKGVLKLGSRKLYLWKGKEGDPRDPTSTPYKAWKAQGMEKLDQIIRRFDQKELPQIQWLDNLSLRRVEKLQLKAAEDESAANRLLGPLFGSAAAMTTPTYGASSPRSMTGLKGDTSALSLPNAATSVDPFALGVGGVSHMPDREADAMFLTVEFPNFPHPVVYHQNPCNPALTPIQEPCPDRIFVLHDPEIESENPIEQKYLKLARSSKGLADRDLKPKVNERKEIARIISNPNKHLNGAEKQLLWTYRFSLIDDKRALTKFLRAVDWRDIDETKQALELMSQWSPIDIADALELLSGYFTNQEVRRYAVAQLERAEDDDLLNYLLQLVQALRYEKVYPSYLSTFLINRSSKSLELANFFYWYATVEKADPKYLQILEDFMDNLERTTKQEDGTTWATVLRDQQKLISQLISLGDQSKLNRRRVDQKVERMHQLLNGDMKHLANLSKIVKMPVRTEIGVTGVVDNECTMFKSALAPMLVCFNTATPSTPTPQGPTEKDDGLQALAASSKYKVIFKIGDDLRQDQLVIQMINLMDSLLKKVNLDLKLTPYRVLATSVEHGFVEFVPKSHTLTSILQDYNRDIKQFFQTHHPKLPELAKVLDTFVKSCAGYCVITYILGVGDRHLENLMLTENGHFFHIDFSFIFGRDPKPFPPPMKFCKEMVLAMGGADSNLYADFRRYCCLAFNILRRNASLILNLLGLMSDANIPNVCNELEKNMLKVQEKFRLDLEDEEAEAFLLSLIDESVSALFPQIVEKIHKWAMYWK